MSEVHCGKKSSGELIAKEIAVARKNSFIEIGNAEVENKNQFEMKSQISS
ncbi:MAG: hypothetical protein IPN80_03615 [Flavobacterium sp.]|nr:hypothetical protein [Flavobacterium sp.]